MAKSVYQRSLFILYWKSCYLLFPLWYLVVSRRLCSYTLRHNYTGQKGHVKDFLWNSIVRKLLYNSLTITVKDKSWWIEKLKQKNLNEITMKIIFAYLHILLWEIWGKIYSIYTYNKKYINDNWIDIRLMRVNLMRVYGIFENLHSSWTEIERSRNFILSLIWFTMFDLMNSIFVTLCLLWRNLTNTITEFSYKLKCYKLRIFSIWLCINFLRYFILQQ